MRWSRSACPTLFLFLSSPVAFCANAKPCIPADDAAKMLKKDLCISAHVYDVVEVSDGTRYLDVCRPETPDEQCRFTIVSPAEDRKTVGELEKYRNQDVRIRGTVQPISGRAGILLSHSRQFSGGAPKFTPNPLLVHGFSAEEKRGPINDPNLRSQGGRRAFMNTRNQMPLPAK